MTQLAVTKLLSTRLYSHRTNGETRDKHTCECRAMPLPRSLFSGLSPMISLVSWRSGVNGPNCGSKQVTVKSHHTQEKGVTQ